MDTLEATTDISRALGGETDQDRVLELIVKRARALVDARVLLILLLDDSGHTLVISALAGEADPSMLGERVPVAGSTSGDVLTSLRSQRLSDVSRRRHLALGESLDAHTGLFMPLAYRGRGLGVLCAYDRPSGEEFTAEDERLLQGFATSAAIAVATAQRFAEQGMRRSIEAAERERTRWARELHDETLQELAGVRVLLSAARRSPGDMAGALDEAVEQIELSITGLRHLITELRPAALDAFGLGAAIEALVERVSGAYGLDIATDVSLAGAEGTEARLEGESESTLYRLTQEALTNIVRHAGAENVHIAVRADGEDVLLEIHDDGRGFDPSERHEGFGLVGMRERVELAGGTLQIRSGEGQGSIITARVPGRRRATDPPSAGAA
jgi:signal transduction histidine kinase